MPRLLAALVAVSLCACGPQNIVEDTGGVAAGDDSSIDAVKSSGGGGGGKNSGGSTSTSIAMQVREGATQSGTFATSFSINDTNTLFFAFDMPSTKSGSHVARFEIYMPSGSPYQVFDVAFAAGTAPAAGETSADVISGGYRVWASMPVAGTMIQQMNLSGTWSAKIFLDGVQVASSSYALY
jgi:hypothetical protein